MPKNPPEKPLCFRAEQFCQEYIPCKFDATKAAINAKYSEKTACSQGNRLLKDPRIQARISELINEELGTNREQLKYKVVKELAELAFCDVTEDIKIVTTQELKTVVNKLGHTSEKMVDIQTVKIADTKNMKNKASIASIKQTDKGIEIKYHAKDKALELLGRYGALFTDKLEVDSNGPEVHIYLPDNGRTPVDDN